MWFIKCEIIYKNGKIDRFWLNRLRGGDASHNCCNGDWWTGSHGGTVSPNCKKRMINHFNYGYASLLKLIDCN